MATTIRQKQLHTLHTSLSNLKSNFFINQITRPFSGYNCCLAMQWSQLSVPSSFSQLLQFEGLTGKVLFRKLTVIIIKGDSAFSNGILLSSQPRYTSVRVKTASGSLHQNSTIFLAATTSYSITPAPFSEDNVSTSKLF